MTIRKEASFNPKTIDELEAISLESLLGRQEIERRKQGKQRLKERLSQIPWYREQAEKGRRRILGQIVQQLRTELDTLFSFMTVSQVFIQKLLKDSIMTQSPKKPLTQHQSILERSRENRAKGRRPVRNVDKVVSLDQQATEQTKVSVTVNRPDYAPRNEVTHEELKSLTQEQGAKVISVNVVFPKIEP